MELEEWYLESKQIKWRIIPHYDWLHISTFPRCPGWTRSKTMAKRAIFVEKLLQGNWSKFNLYIFRRMFTWMPQGDSPSANLGVFSNGKWTHVDEQCHTAVHERVKRGSWQTILFMEGPKKHVHERPFIQGQNKSLLNKQKTHSTNDFVGGVGFLPVHERCYVAVHEQQKEV